LSGASGPGVTTTLPCPSTVTVNPPGVSGKETAGVPSVPGVTISSRGISTGTCGTVTRQASPAAGGSTTCTLTVASAEQFAGFSTSQIVYASVYWPPGVPGETVTVPSGFNTTPGTGLPPASLSGTPPVTSCPPTCRVTVSESAGPSFTESLPSTLGTVPPACPFTGPKRSSEATIVRRDTGSRSVASSATALP